MNVRKQKLLIVEDEEAIREGLVDLFIFHGFDVSVAEDGEKGLHKGLHENFDAIILDIMLPKMSGYDVCNKLRESNRSMPIIMLTAKTNEEDIITGLSLGADDYISKPFSVRELVLRVQVILKRTKQVFSPSISLSNDLKIFPESLEGKFEKSGETITFSLREIKLIDFLFQRSGVPASRNEILESVWGYTNAEDIETRTVDIHVAKLRQKIEEEPKNPQFITTCLLYTSPSPRDRTRSRMPSSA